MDGAVDAAPTQQARVGGVDDRVDFLPRQVAPEELDAAAREQRYFDAPSAASLAAFATTNFSRLRAGILISSPVWGFRPTRAL